MARKAKKSKKSKKTTRKGSPSQIAAVRKEYNTVKRAYKLIGNKLGKLTGIK